MQRRTCLGVPLALWLAGHEAWAAAQETRRADCVGTTRVVLDMAADVVIRPGPGRWSVTADRQVLEKLKITQVAGVLSMSGVHQANNQSPVRVVLEVQPLSALTLRGALDVKAEGCLAAKATLDVDGASDVEINGLAMSELQLAQGGSTNVALNGRCDQLRAAVNGSSDLNADGFTCQRVQIKADGSGDLAVWAQRELDADLSGSTTLRIKGQPRLKKRLSGAASIEGVD